MKPMSNPNTSPNQLTLSNTGGEDVIEFIKQDLLQCIDEGLERYKSQMSQFLLQKQPLKHSQLKKLHEDSSKVLRQAMKESYQDQIICIISEPTILSSKINALIHLAQTRLEKLMNKELNNRYIRKHEIQNDDLIKKVKGFTNQAEILYDDEAEQFDLKGKTKTELKNAHRKWVDAAMALFNKLLKENQVGRIDFWWFEIRSKLKERYDELCQDLIEINQDCSKPLSNETLIGYIAEHSSPNNSTGTPISSPTVVPIKPKEGGKFPQTNDLPHDIVPTDVEVGIYFDKISFKVALYQPTPRKSSTRFFVNQLKSLASVTPEIYFADQGQLIGSQVQPFYRSDPSRYFNVFDLIISNTVKTSRSFCIRIENKKHTLCSSQIVAVFLHRVLKDIEANNVARVRKIVMTIPLALTSAMKEMIKESSQIAGFMNIRILSTLLTTAIATLDKSEYYKDILRTQSSQKNSVVSPMHLLILDIQRDSFSLGIVAINSTSISIENSYGSESMLEGKNNNFKSYHKSLYDNHVIDKDSQDLVTEVYKKAITHANSSLKLSLLNCIVTNTNEIEFPTIMKIVFSILKGRIMVKNGSLQANPLLGASILAASTTNSERSHGLKYILPSYVKIQDSCRSDLRLTIQLQNQPIFVFTNENKKLKNGIVFQKTLIVPFKMDGFSPVSFSLRLDEIYGNGIYIINAGTYELTCFPEKSVVSTGLGLGFLNNFHLHPILLGRGFNFGLFRPIVNKGVDIVNKFRGINEKQFQINITCYGNSEGIYILTADCDSEFFQSSDALQRIDKIRCGLSGCCGNMADHMKVIRLCEQFVNSR